MNIRDDPQHCRGPILSWSWQSTVSFKFSEFNMYYWTYDVGNGCLRVPNLNKLGPNNFPPPPPPPHSKLSIFLGHPLCRWSSLLTREGGRLGGLGEKPNHTTVRKPGPLQVIQYSPILTMLGSLTVRIALPYIYEQHTNCVYHYLIKECPVHTWRS